MKKTKAWFSIIEVLIGIFIFSLWLVSVYALILLTLKLNDYSKNSIIASNLARESIEDIRNIRDNNFKNLFKWNKFPWENPLLTFQTGTYYTIESDLINEFHNWVILKDISDFAEWKNELNGKMKKYQLCLTVQKMYTYDCEGNVPTSFYRYVYISDVTYSQSGVKKVIPDAMKVTVKVIWYSRGYHEIQMDTILTDFLRQ